MAIPGVPMYARVADHSVKWQKVEPTRRSLGSGDSYNQRTRFHPGVLDTDNIDAWIHAYHNRSISWEPEKNLTMSLQDLRDLL